MGPGDAIWAGFADSYVPEPEWPALIERLAETGDPDVITDHPVPPSALAGRDLSAFAGDSVADIIAAVDEPLDATSCGGKENCHDAHVCMTHDLWTNLNRRMYEYLHSVTLASLVEQQRRKVAQHAVLHDERAASATRSGGKQALIA